MKNIVYVENQNFVSVTKEGFKFTNLATKEKRYLTFGDVGFLVFDNRKCYFSAKVIEKCCTERINLLFCDRAHSPLAVMETIYNQPHRFARFKHQLALSSKVKNRLWKKIVIAKIQNQIACLEQADPHQGECQIMKSIIKNVTEGDRHNCEAYAARWYFKTIFGTEFKRGRTEDLINAGLNYGYAILRSVIRRELVMRGLEPCIGIHHASTDNPFNLSDDLIEPYRPFVDDFVLNNLLITTHESLELEDRKLLVQVLLQKCVIDNKVMRLGDALQTTVDSFVAAITAGSSAWIKLPAFIEGGA
ncbi:type II CRISPR-associated endonuclease Cas1 [Ligilactobacillus saerimneri]|uniref:CRISPR-associated endonuclease Cas1, NMENI subtype n=1 Tax=Ligilactobacillus saerimneri 30a TaxID=1227363 RepID=M5J4L2_9LACO|nr:type II CRISPR-associated endonuclease Cas1 [Ligilactobacillus saerimneri]EKW98571.1 CRISPR-associated endonuclease Cas1, NMENI subtype [Ligilactobacillus saerimneri 30a]MBU5309078.1 type II CRISPR-associated endonuclease Cas1 [Ligilactobacillus saerimneri]